MHRIDKTAGRGRATVRFVLTVAFLAAAGTAVWVGSRMGGWMADRALQQFESAIQMEYRREVRMFFTANGVKPWQHLTVAELNQTFTGAYADNRNWLGIDLGETAFRFRLPVRLLYAVDLSDAAARPLTFTVDRATRTLHVTAPVLELLAVETDLGEMETELDVGWARSRFLSGRDVEARFREHVMEDMRTQATSPTTLSLVRSTARRQLAEFARNYLMNRDLWGAPMIDTIVVRFRDEPATFRPPSHTVIRAVTAPAS